MPIPRIRERIESLRALVAAVEHAACVYLAPGPVTVKVDSIEELAAICEVFGAEMHVAAGPIDRWAAVVGHGAVEVVGPVVRRAAEMARADRRAS